MRALVILALGLLLLALQACTSASLLTGGDSDKKDDPAALDGGSNLYGGSDDDAKAEFSGEVAAPANPKYFHLEQLQKDESAATIKQLLLLLNGGISVGNPALPAGNNKGDNDVDFPAPAPQGDQVASGSAENDDGGGFGQGTSAPRQDAAEMGGNSSAPSSPTTVTAEGPREESSNNGNLSAAQPQEADIVGAYGDVLYQIRGALGSDDNAKIRENGTGATQELILVDTSKKNLGAVLSKTKVPGQAIEMFVLKNRVIVFSRQNYYPMYYGGIGVATSPGVNRADIDVANTPVTSAMPPRSKLQIADEAPWGKHFPGVSDVLYVLTYNTEDVKKPYLERRLMLPSQYVSARKYGSTIHIVVNTDLFGGYYRSNILNKRGGKIADLAEEDIEQSLVDTAYADGDQGTDTKTGFVVSSLAISKKQLEDMRALKDAKPSDAKYRERWNFLPRSITTIVSFDAAEARGTLGVASILGNFAGNIYASARNIYIYAENPAFWADKPTSTIHQFVISGERGRARYAASGLVPGRILNQFSLNEYDGYLRVASSEGFGGFGVGIALPGMGVDDSMPVSSMPTVGKAMPAGDPIYLCPEGEAGVDVALAVEDTPEGDAAEMVAMYTEGGGDSVSPSRGVSAPDYGYGCASSGSSGGSPGFDGVPVPEDGYLPEGIAFLMAEEEDLDAAVSSNDDPGSANAGEADTTTMSTTDVRVDPDTTISSSSPDRAPRQEGENFISILENTDGELAQVGIVKGFQKNEEIKAARFIGTRAFVVTFRQTDPLFTFDLSDPEKPVKVGELKIPGYSSYLQAMTDDTLLGIGRDADKDDNIANAGLQLSMFDVSDLAKPTRLQKLGIGDSGTSSEAETSHKAFSYFGEEGLLALPITLMKETKGTEPEPRPLPTCKVASSCACVKAPCDCPPVPEERCDMAVQSDAYYGSTYTVAFDGVILYSVDEKTGFSELARITHTDMLREDERQTASYGWIDPVANVRRTMLLNDMIFTFSALGIKIHDAADPKTLVKKIVFERPKHEKPPVGTEPEPFPGAPIGTEPEPNPNRPIASDSCKAMCEEELNRCDADACAEMYRECSDEMVKEYAASNSCGVDGGSSSPNSGSTGGGSTAPSTGSGSSGSGGTSPGSTGSGGATGPSCAQEIAIVCEHPWQRDACTVAGKQALGHVCIDLED